MFQSFQPLFKFRCHAYSFIAGLGPFLIIVPGSSSSLSHHVFFKTSMITERIITVMTKGIFIHNTRYMGMSVRQHWPMIPSTTLNISSLNLLLGTKPGSEAITSFAMGVQKPQGLTFL